MMNIKYSLDLIKAPFLRTFSNKHEASLGFPPMNLTTCDSCERAAF